MEMNSPLIRTNFDTSLSVLERECEKRNSRVCAMTSLRFCCSPDRNMFCHMSQADVRATHVRHPFESAELLSGLQYQVDPCWQWNGVAMVIVTHLTGG
jgi:hypothetical protein